MPLDQLDGTKPARPPNTYRHLLHEVVRLLPEVSAIAIAIGLVWFSLLMPLRQEIAATEQTAVEATSNLARAFDENTERIVSGIDQILLTARAAYTDAGGQLDLKEWTAKRVKVDKFAFFIGRVDKDGMTRESTLVPPPPSINIADREHFRAQLDPSKDELFISQPVVGRATKRPALQFTRKLLARDGSFDGIVQISLDSSELSHFYDTLEIGKGVISLAGNDGVVRARGPLDVAEIGKPVGTPADLAVIAGQDSGTLIDTAGPLAGDVVSFRHLHDYPLTVLVRFDHGDIYEKYSVYRRNAFITGALTSAVLLALGVLWINQRRRGVRSQRALEITLESISQGIVMLDGYGRMPVINGRARQILNLAWNISTAVDGALQSKLAIPAIDPAGPANPVSAEITRPDGQIIEVQRNAITSGGMVLTYTDVTDRRLAEARIHHLAQHDALTGLANRSLLAEALLAAIRFAEPDGEFAVLCLDLDGFKEVNDSLGHAAGDVLLANFAERLRSVVRETDMIARTGGDEFTIILVGGEHPLMAETFAHRLLAALHHPVSIDGCNVQIRTSIGIALYPRDGRDSRTLQRNADTALYRAKEDGRGVHRVFEPWMDTFHQERRLLEQDLRAAIEAGELDVYMQPQFDCDTLAVTGFESLLRWKHVTRGFIPPSTFVPIAEECGLIVPLGQFVLERACEMAATWAPRYRVAVNVSPVQFRHGKLPALVAETLRRTGLPPQFLEVEVTEGVLIGDEQHVLTSLRAIKQLGVRIALDDFGTGYSSLGYLRRFPFDKIKIDKSFVQAQQHDTGTQAIIDAVFAMSSRLRLDVTAEGVETEEQLTMLRSQRCTEIQGFLMGRPMPGEDVPAFLAQARLPTLQFPAPQLLATADAAD